MLKWIFILYISAFPHPVSAFFGLDQLRQEHAVAVRRVHAVRDAHQQAEANLTERQKLALEYHYFNSRHSHPGFSQSKFYWYNIAHSEVARRDLAIGKYLYDEGFRTHYDVKIAEAVLENTVRSLEMRLSLNRVIQRARVFCRRLFDGG